MALAVSMASCSLDEVMEQPAQQAIGFSSFVGKPTRAATELVTPGSQSGTALNKFYVFGKYGTTQGGTYTTDVFSNVKVEVTKANTAVSTDKYWIANKYYKFAAYSNGNDKIETNVSFDESGHIKFTDYEAGTNDLILATPDEVSTGATISSQPDAVSLEFKHLLSQVAFEFKNGFTNGYKVAITDLKFNVNNKATYSYQNNAYSWAMANPASNEDKEYTVNGGTAFAESDGSKTSESNFVIPQSNSSITASFTVEVSDGQNVVATKEYNATNNNAVSLATGTTTTPSGSDTWIAGYKYKYTATIDANILSDVMFPIQFTVTSVEDWETADGDTSGEGTDFDLTLNGNGN